MFLHSKRDADEQQGRIDEDGETDDDWKLTASYYWQTEQSSDVGGVLFHKVLDFLFTFIEANVCGYKVKLSWMHLKFCVLWICDKNQLWTSLAAVQLSDLFPPWDWVCQSTHQQLRHRSSSWCHSRHTAQRRPRHVHSCVYQLHYVGSQRYSTLFLCIAGHPARSDRTLQKNSSVKSQTGSFNSIHGTLQEPVVT